MTRLFPKEKLDGEHDIDRDMELDDPIDGVHRARRSTLKR